LVANLHVHEVTLGEPVLGSDLGGFVLATCIAQLTIGKARVKVVMDDLQTARATNLNAVQAKGCSKDGGSGFLGRLSWSVPFLDI
jgi:hypothetical protein